MALALHACGPATDYAMLQVCGTLLCSAMDVCCNLSTGALSPCKPTHQPCCCLFRPKALTAFTVSNYCACVSWASAFWETVSARPILDTLQAQQARAAFVVCPCCIGKLNAPQIAASLQQPLLLPSVISRKQDGSSSSSGAIDEDGALDQGWRQHVQSRLQHPRSRCGCCNHCVGTARRLCMSHALLAVSFNFSHCSTPFLACAWHRR